MAHFVGGNSDCIANPGVADALDASMQIANLSSAEARTGILATGGEHAHLEHLVLRARVGEPDLQRERHRRVSTSTGAHV